jgi:predicted glycogen debranching enzyme
MNPLVVRKLRDVPPIKLDPPDLIHHPEWLVANGLGGFASGTVSGAMSRRYHGLLIAAFPAPLGRMLMLSDLNEELQLPGNRVVQLSTRYGDSGEPTAKLIEFRLEMGLPVWRYQIDDWMLEKWLHLPYRQNAVHITYKAFACPDRTRIKLRPLIQYRGHSDDVDAPLKDPYVLTVLEDQYEISTGTLPPLRLLLYGKSEFVIDRKKIEKVRYLREEQRGYLAIGELWTPGAFILDAAAGEENTLVASTESWEVMRAMRPDEALAAERDRRTRLIASADSKAHSGFPAELVLAADQFIAVPTGRLVDQTRTHASGDEMRTVIAGYHWFTDWGRDTMISLEGLTLVTRRFLEAGWILRNFAKSIRHGLIPNLFPEGSREGLYHTADATLWFFHAIERYVQATGDRWTLRFLLPKLIEIFEAHVRGTLFGIRVDPEDGLLRQGEEGYQLTWMDAKVGDWVVTPRRGKAVEIVALWYNALRLLQKWVDEEKDQAMARKIGAWADRAKDSFNKKFWYAEGGYLYDVIEGPEGNDAACRPNQLLAISLDYPILEPARWQPVLRTVQQRLLTPVGLRSLDASHPEYKTRYFGDIRARDAAYHQGTIWAWLIGPLIDAWLKVYPDDRAGAHALLQAFIPHMNEHGIGTISEVFDAERPWTPHGCIAQAWSVAEVLRCWIKTAPEKTES